MKTRTKRILQATVGGLSLALAIFLVPTCWGKPWSIDHAGMRALVEVGIESPEMLSSMRPLDQLGLDWYSDELDDRDYHRRVEMFDFADEYLALIRSYDHDSLDETDQLTQDALEWLLVEVTALRPFAYHDYPLNQMFGVQSGLPDFMVNTHAIEDVEDAEDYVARVRQFERAFDQVIEGLRHREQLGVIPPRFVIDRVAEEMRGFVAPAPRENVLFTHFSSELDELEDLDPDERAELETALADAIEHQVYPVYGRMIAYYEELAPKAGDDDGVWHLPEGDALYDRMLRVFTTSDMGADEIHALGRSEVARIQGEIRSILEAQGFSGTSFLELMQNLEADPRFYYPDTDAGREQILADYASIIAEIDAGLAPFFNHRPEAAVEVRRELEFKEETAPGAHYQPPPLDGSRPGVFYANLKDIKATPKYGMRTLAYHEAVPGHHYQIALSMENDQLPLFRRMLPFGAYIEGWALYAEQLAAEQGYEEDPFDRVGYLQAELFRAVRLVVDTGIHRKRWSRQQAIDYMRQNTGMAESDVVAEIERYIVMPGQACSYKIGQLEILRLRDEAKATLGSAFDLREFHDVILMNGPLPLELLERVVDDWVASKT